MRLISGIIPRGVLLSLALVGHQTWQVALLELSQLHASNPNTVYQL